MAAPVFKYDKLLGVVATILQLPAIGIENLDSMVFPVGDINITLLVRTNTVDQVEFTGTAAGRAPRKQVRSVR